MMGKWPPEVTEQRPPTSGLLTSPATGIRSPKDHIAGESTTAASERYWKMVTF